MTFEKASIIVITRTLRWNDDTLYAPAPADAAATAAAVSDELTEDATAANDSEASRAARPEAPARHI